MNLNCVKGNILIELPEIKETTESGIIKSEEMMAAEYKDSNVVKVLSVGEEVTVVKKGDRVMIKNTHVPIFEHEGKRYGGISEYDVFCIVK